MALPTCTGAGSTGNKFTYAQLEALWINAGGSQSVAPIAAAIAMAESGGCSAALNTTDNGGTQSSWGLWQISDGSHNQPVSGILDPNVNAAAAVKKWRNHGGSFDDWGTYTSGAYRKYVAASTTPDFAAVPNSSAPAGTPVQTVANASGDPTCSFGIPPMHIPVLGDFPGWCILSKSAMRGFIGGTLIVMGGTVFALGLAVVAAGAFKAGGAAGAAARGTAGVVTGIARKVTPNSDGKPAPKARRKTGGKTAPKPRTAAKTAGKGTS